MISGVFRWFTGRRCISRKGVLSSKKRTKSSIVVLCGSFHVALLSSMIFVKSRGQNTFFGSFSKNRIMSGLATWILAGRRGTVPICYHLDGLVYIPNPSRWFILRGYGHIRCSVSYVYESI